MLGGPCDGCELIHVGMPAQLAATARIAPDGEPGEPLVLEGTVRTPDGSPADGIVVYAYQTDAKGLYPAGDTRHGRLRGWARTGADGRYRFDTVRPGAYPRRSDPQHIHVHVLEPGRGTYYLDDVVFGDDPLLTPERRARMAGRGGSGIVAPRREGASWRARRDIVLGAGIPGHPPLP
ncbi:MAG TPA: hypothetical protein VFO79_06335 [Xanthomonadales bacterium]|nr:hypothetical protein [Xanthomonadales bacterium]